MDEISFFMASYVLSCRRFQLQRLPFSLQQLTSRGHPALSRWRGYWIILVTLFCWIVSTLVWWRGWVLRSCAGITGSRYRRFLSKNKTEINPLNAELSPICHLLALLEGATIVVVSRLRVNAQNCIDIKPLNAELNPICHLLALLGGANIVVVSRLRVK